ncbi:MAG TPA: hypothetical protein VE547_11505, partial [Mycobacteriales bacterium]|nr:hypothetical protein [Mycobacteriales bacterium]
MVGGRSERALDAEPGEPSPPADGGGADADRGAHPDGGAHPDSGADADGGAHADGSGPERAPAPAVPVPAPAAGRAGRDRELTSRPGTGERVGERRRWAVAPLVALAVVAGVST